MDSPAENVTGLLRRSREGDREALERLMPVVYGELRRLANRYMSGERRGHTLQATALVHEAYARLVGVDITWRDRVQFFKAAAQAMRRVLVDHARAKRSAKRGGGEAPVTLDEMILEPGSPPPDLIALNDALETLAKTDQRKSYVVELHFFAGLSYDEIARALDISPATVDRDMRFARAWLKREISGETGAS